jgi:hypothetical protein
MTDNPHSEEDDHARRQFLGLTISPSLLILADEVIE